jgi:hypothetical protein
MEKAGKMLNLAPHVVAKKTIFGPGDIEVHLSKKDNNFYMLDFGRVFPAEGSLIAYVKKPPKFFKFYYFS